MHITLAMVLASASSATSKKSSGSSAYSLLILVGIFVIAYFVMIRPARRRQRTAMTDRGNCEVGDDVTTTAGLLATVAHLRSICDREGVAIDDEAVTLEIAPGVHSRFLKSAIVKVNYPPDEDYTDDAHGAGPIEHEAIAAPDDHEAIDPQTAPPEQGETPGDKPNS